MHAEGKDAGRRENGKKGKGKYREDRGRTMGGGG
jgi:hypothetical protein